MTSCLDWPRLLDERERAAPAVDFEASGVWRDAVRHLRTCARCRAAALRLEPSLVFAAQPPVEVNADEIARIQANVRTLVRARRAERAAGEARRRLGRVAAAAAIVGLMILVPTRTARQPASPPSAGPTLATERTTPAPRSLILGEAPAPMIEPLDLPFARIYQLGEGDLSVVMVVDESIDV